MSRVGLIYLKRFLNVFCCNWGKRQSVDNGHPSWRFTSRTMSYGKAGQIVGTNLLTGYYEWGRTCEGAPLNTWPILILIPDFVFGFGMTWLQALSPGPDGHFVGPPLRMYHWYCWPYHIQFTYAASFARESCWNMCLPTLFVKNHSSDV